MSSTATEKIRFPSIEESPWDTEIVPPRITTALNLPELLRYRHLIAMFVRRDFVVYYRQTVLGPLWWLLQPLITCGVFVIVFGVFLRIYTDGIPRPLFYLSGLTLWAYFAGSFTHISSLFSSQGGLFGKIYFPRLAVPVAQLLSNLMKFGLQTSFMTALYLIYVLNGLEIRPSWTLVFAPLLILYLAVLALGFGLLFNSLAYKYRDMSLTTPFIIQMWMFLSFIIYPMSAVPEKYHWFLCFNPVIPAVETFRYMLFGTGTVPPWYWGISLLTTVIVLALGLTSFAYTSQRFIDTV
ncbi:MAG: ABC transporter permease [Planctomycetaceae bacterium]|jgi:lipopolysaccharide transport system permease protein|nr:ABC transporter permease [Planctomycetaceae bacterium]